jgi:hypothetical protein
MRRSRVVGAGVALAAAVAGVALALFEPWQLWVDTRVDEPIPVASPTSPAGAGSPSAPGDPTTSLPAEPQSNDPEVLASGDLISHEQTQMATSSYSSWQTALEASGWRT